MPSSLFTCPVPTALASIPSQACPEIFDQIIRVFFQRKQTTASFTTTTLLLEATWTPLLTAVDSTKVIKSPLIPNVVIPSGDPIKEGGNDNTTINGIPRLGGLGFVPVTMELQNTNAAVRAALRALASESSISPGYTNLWAYFVNRYGQIITDISSTNCPGIPVYNVVVGDVGTEGFAKQNIAKMSFDLAPGWSNAVQILTPAFDPIIL